MKRQLSLFDCSYKRVNKLIAREVRVTVSYHIWMIMIRSLRLHLWLIQNNQKSLKRNKIQHQFNICLVQTMIPTVQLILHLKLIITLINNVNN